MATPTLMVAANRPADVSYVRSDVVKCLPRWKMVRDCLGGESVIKAAGDTYLPRPNPDDLSEDNQKRYASYLQRAVFYGVTKRTLEGLVGQVFVREPIFDLKNARLETFGTDADGAGIGIVEQSKTVLANALAYGRFGLLADYPPVDGTATVAQLERGFIRPTVLAYSPEQVVNWRTTVVGGRQILSLLVLMESYTQQDDGYAPAEGVQWRELRLVGGQYVVTLWRESPQADGALARTSRGVSLSVVRRDVPRDARGNPFQEIPFVVGGAMKNSPDIGPIPLEDLASLNIAHYRNSADYEEASYLVGQPTPWAAGLTEQWIQSVWKGKLILGSRTTIPLPVGAQCGLLQVNPNSMPKEAMDAKERQMVALGAKVIEQRLVQRTLGEAQIETSGEASILTSCAKNVSAAYNRVLQFAEQYAGGQGGTTFTLNTDFLAAALTYQERAQLVAEWQSGGISYTEYRAALRKAGLASQDDKAAATEAKKDKLRLSGKLAVGGNPGNSVSGGANNGRTAPSQDGKTQ